MIYKELTVQTSSEIREMCIDNPGYRVLILVASYVIQDSLLSFLIDKFNGVEKVISTNKSITTSAKTDVHIIDEIIFTNGSSIAITIPRDGVKAKRVNAILYDDGINKEVLETVYKPMLADYKRKYVPPKSEIVELGAKSDVLTGSVENFSSYIDPNPGDWGDPIFDDDDEIDW